ncbi:phage tail tape measure protein [Streptomyces sp. NBC_00340]|uniref:phage tail tape measure protein n=1 Tax=Streptomyces sp. NBC_00340 TaxID=2975716 RepID=UPI0022588FE3|nr:phage tail tape measure protein [Streptomyces sp. NBC_00340]MCX5137574.1 phage tail tape measure protein [Streptomyces sp. NBC_00340]
MATRTVTVRLRADISSYTRGMRSAASSTSRLAGAGAAVGTAMVTGFAIAAASAAKFDKALSNVRAVTGASSAQMKQLRSAALDAGKTTAYTATEAADAEAELARAGVSVANITGGALKGSLALAASGQLDLSESATIAAQTMNTFGLKGKDVTHIADVLSASANKSASDVHGLGMSLRMGGLLAHQTGLSLEDTVGTLSAFADHALIGSDAGTSLKVMLQRLVPQSDEAKAAMQKIGFSAYDASGKFVGLSELAGRMKTSFSKLTPEARNSAMATIFGADAVRSATILYELGSKGIDKYVSSVNDQGAASRMASIQTDNLVGDFERLKGAIEVALIEGGSAANGSLRTMTQWITRLVNAYSSLPPELQKGITMFSGIGGATALAGAGILLLLPRIAATRAALASMGVTAARTRAALGMLGKAGAVVAGLELISYASEKIRDQFKDAPPSVSKMASSLVDLGKNGKISGEGIKSLGKDLSGFGEAVNRVAHPDWEARTTDVVNSLTFNLTKGLMESQIPLDDAKDKIKSVDQALGQLVSSGNPQLAADAFNKLAGAAAADGTSKEKLLTLLPEYGDGLANLDVQAKTSATSQAELAKQLGVTADELQDNRTEAEKLVDALNSLNGVNISAGEKEISFRQSLADLTDAVKENGRSLDVTSEKGRKVKSAFLDAAQAAMDHAQAVAQQKDSQQAGQAVLAKDIELLKAQMHAAGFSKDAIEKLTSSYAQLPLSVTTKVDAKTAGAVADLEAVKAKVASTKGKTITMAAPTKEARAQLEALGFKIKNTKGKNVTITVPTGGQKRAVDALAAAIRNLQSKSVSVTTTFYTRGSKSAVAPAHRNYATGGRIRGYASGGSPMQFAPDGLLNGPGTGTSDSILAVMASGAVARVSATEFVVNAKATKRYLPLLTAINSGKIPGFASGGLADGGLAGFTYTPTGAAVLGGPSDAKQRYDGEIEDLKKAWDDLNKALKEQKKAADNLRAAEKNLSKVRHGHHTAAQLRAAEERRDKAKKAKRSADSTVKKERADVYAADKELGLKKGAKAPKTFSLKAYETQLNESVGATEKWRKNLAKVGKRGGKELQAMLEGMGEEGYALVNALAGASDKQFKSITTKLQKTGELAKATLADFNKQLGASTKENQQFAADLQKLAAQGFGDLAQALAAQGDASAMTLAHEAAGNSKSAAAANKSVGTAQNTLTGEDLANSLVLLSTLRGGQHRGYADLIAAGLDTATIKALVPKMTKQISSLPTANKDTFVRQWVQQGGKAMALGGVLSRPTMVLGGEAGVRESWIPWTNTARSKGLLARTAAGMGYHLVPAGRYSSGATSTAAIAREVSKQITVNLYGAKQTAAEQAHDLARVISFVG